MWEYKAVTFEDDKILEEMSSLGKEGWELCSVLHDVMEWNAKTGYFKRWVEKSTETVKIVEKGYCADLNKIQQDSETKNLY